MSKHPEEVLLMVHSRKWKQNTWLVAGVAAAGIAAAGATTAYFHLDGALTPLGQSASAAAPQEPVDEAAILEAVDAANAAAADAAAAAPYADAYEQPADGAALHNDVELWCEENNQLLKTHALYIYKINSTARTWWVCEPDGACTAPKPLAMFGDDEIRFEDNTYVGAIWRSNTGVLNIYEWHNKTQRNLDCEVMEPGRS